MIAMLVLVQLVVVATEQLIRAAGSVLLECLRRLFRDNCGPVVSLFTLKVTLKSMI